MNKLLSTILVAMLLLAIVPAASAQQEETGAIAVPLWNANAYSTTDGAYENLLVVLEEGARYPILGRNSDDSWFLINYGAGQGWVRGCDIVLTGDDIKTVPVTGAAGTAAAAVVPAAGGYTAIPTVSLLNVRATPSTSADLISRVSAGNRYPVLGRNEGATWLLINHGEGQGWVFGTFVKLLGGDVNALPVTNAVGNLVGAPASTASAAPAAVAAAAPAASGLTVTPNAWLLNVRKRPSTAAAVLGSLEWGHSYPVVGRNADTSWLLVDDDEARGWVSAKFVNVAGGDINSAVVTDVEGTPGAQAAVAAATTSATTTAAVTGTAPAATTAPASGSTVFAVALWELNVRARATTLSDVLVRIKANSRYPIIGRLADGSWWLIDYGTGQGWISSGYARYEFEGGGMDFEDVPVIE